MFLRHEAASQPDLGVQLDVFEEQRESDEAQGPGGINLNSHLDVFYAILKQVRFRCLINIIFIYLFIPTTINSPLLNVGQHFVWLSTV